MRSGSGIGLATGGFIEGRWGRDGHDPTHYRVRRFGASEWKDIQHPDPVFNKAQKIQIREAFAMRFGLRLGAVRDWEQRKRRPEGGARVLLTVIEKVPEAVARALAAAAA